jgi:hypothetical protein
MSKKTLEMVISLINIELDKSLDKMNTALDAETEADYSYITDDDEDEEDYTTEELEEINHDIFERSSGEVSALTNLREMLQQKIEAIDKKPKKKRSSK